MIALDGHVINDLTRARIIDSRIRRFERIFLGASSEEALELALSAEEQYERLDRDALLEWASRLEAEGR